MISQNNFYRNKTAWLKIKIPNAVPFNKIKAGHKYHIPPILGKDRVDIEIVTANKYFIRTKAINGSDNKGYEYIYDFSPSAKFLFEIKNE